MSESEEDNEHFCFYGKPLEQFDEEAVPRKRPISVEEQIATDAQGRRRFHGAFTGGFSAGFFNTVGSLEGWLPGEFKSSRSEKSETVTQKPEDFMDDEDLGEDGFAPQVVRATKEYNTSRKRRKQVFSEGPIPGEPVLHNILTSGNETIGYMLLKNLRIKDKKKKQVEQKTYGCQMPVTDLFDSSAEQQYEIPELYKEFLAKPKDNTFGLGYSGLDKSRFSLFPTVYNQQFKAVSGDKKFSISGQAFGVGAFEEEDDDIYVRDDMSKYDFELKSERDEAKARTEQSLLVLGLFERSKEVLSSTRKYPAPTIPHSFTGKHRVKKSRFEPVPEEENQTKKTTKINPMIRAKYLGEEVQEDTVSQAENPQNPVDPGGLNDRFVSSNTVPQAETSSYLNDRFVSSGKKEDVGDILEVVEKTETIHGTSQMREAARMKMFGPLTRITSDWSPSTLLCKRFNVPEPFVDRPEKSRTRTKNIIFEYQKHQEEIRILQPGLKKEEPATPVNETEETTNFTEPMEEDKEETSTTNKSNEDNKPKDLTEPIHLEEQQDLFKAIFLSDSEEEEETVKSEETAGKNEDQVRKEEMKSSVLSDQLIPKIKPLKEGGILSGINFVSMKKREERNKEETEKNQEKEEEKSNLYGPKMPDILVATPKTNPTSVRNVKEESEDEWVEKNDSDSDDEGKRRKEKKKHKKEKKHKHKKHKYKKKH